MAGNRTVWCDPSILLHMVYFAFVPDEVSWRATMKRLSYPATYPPLEGNPACCSHLTNGDATVALVTVAEYMDKKASMAIAEVLTHEGTHIWQRAKNHIAEREPSLEFEALMMDHIVTELLLAYERTRQRIFTRTPAATFAHLVARQKRRGVAP